MSISPDEIVLVHHEIGPAVIGKPHHAACVVMHGLLPLVQMLREGLRTPP